MKLPIPDDWQGEWCNWSICWPDSPSWEAILMGFLTLPQRGRTWDERTGSVRDVQAIGRMITDENLPLWGCIMSCRDTGISDAIRYLADRLATIEFCCNGAGPGPGIIGGGTGGSGGTTGPASEVDDGDTSGDPPEGWETWEAYFANKCDAAHWIIGQWRDDLERAQQATFYAGMATTVAIRLLALAILTPIPGDELVLMAATVIAAVGAGLISAVLEGLEAVFTGFYDELVCALYEAENVAAAEAAVRGVFEARLDIDVPLAEGWALSLLRHWLTADNLNRLFEPNEDISYPAGDCSACDEPGPYYYRVDYPGQPAGEPVQWDGAETTVNLSGTSDASGLAFVISFYEADATTPTCSLVDNFTKTGIRDTSHWYFTCNGAQVSPAPLAARYCQSYAFFTSTATQAWTMAMDIEHQTTWP